MNITGIGLENNIMNNFVDGVDDIVKPSNDDTTGQNGVLDMLDDDDDFVSHVMTTYIFSSVF